MKSISLKVDESIFAEAEKVLASLKIPRNRYINDAIEYYNKKQKRKLLEKQMRKESLLVREDSMRILKEFEELGYED